MVLGLCEISERTRQRILADPPLVRQLVNASADRLVPALTLLHQVARLFAGRMLSTTEAVEAFAGLTHSLGRLVETRAGANA